ncbi:hypothetical protein K432DRAFT_385491 [Lepidopterella palustris CBS 459.81]|uniref:Cytochrome b-c1 complex subunit 10 n=1 Tax=Lepidopterella palustris CBS 459.81 TaxID=1314670 RepID=A0A8E2E380_9PEZI|nr:hypothetical protein K432DRAFT_385491 [Lepidopterella palustris CBS 459.81]
MSGQFTGHHGLQSWSVRENYKTYKSPFGPKYKAQWNFHGLTTGRMINYGMTAGAFGGVAGIFLIFFFSDLPRVRKDIMQKVPVIGDYFVREIPPEDNPF